MTIRRQDVLWMAGGNCYRSFGVLKWGLTRSQRLAVPTYTRSDTAAGGSQDGQLRYVSANRVRTVWHPDANDDLRPYLRLEAPRENEFLRSQELDNAAWTKSDTSIVANQATGPDGTLVLDSVIESGAVANHYILQAVTGMTADAAYALSGFFIAANRTIIRLSVFETAASANLFNTWFNLSTGAVGTADDGGTGAIIGAYVEDWTHVYPGLYRCVAAGTVGNGATAVTGYFELCTADGSGAGYDGDGASGLQAGCLQLEHGREASSYIPTTTAALARGAEAFSDAFPYTPRQLADMGGATFYADFIEGLFPNFVNEGGANPRLIAVAASNLASPQVRLARGGGGDGYLFAYNDGTTDRTSTIDLNPTRGSRIQLAGQFNPDGSVRVLGRKDGTTNATGSTSSANTLPAAWSDDLIHLGGAGTVGRGIQDYADAIVFRGLHDIDESEAFSRRLVAA